MKRTTNERKFSHGLPNKGLMLLAVLALPLFLAKTAFAENSAPASFAYWHVWTDPHGISHQKKCEIRNFVLESIEPPAAPQWLRRLKTGGASVVISVLPVGWVGIWHENPKPQWIIPISGRWYVETTDGQ